MKMKMVLLLTALMIPFIAFGQVNKKKDNELKTALEWIKEGDTTKAINYLHTIIQNGYNSKALSKLSEIELTINSIQSLDSAKINIEAALKNEPLNVNYLNLYAKIKEVSFYKIRDAFFDRNQAMTIYKSVLKLQPNNKIALYNLGRLKTEDYLDYSISVLKYDTNKVLTPANRMVESKKGSTLLKEKINEFLNTPGSYVINSYNDVAEKDYISAEENLFKVLGDSTFGNKALAKILILYYNKKYYDKAIQLYKNFLIENKDAKEVHMLAGLIYEAMSNHEGAYSEYINTLKYLTPQEKEDITLNSVFAIIKEKPENVFSEKTEKIMLIQKYWEINDPLLLTSYSERMLAHYARFVYANIFLGSRRTGLLGWKSNRGEIVLRYGIPLKREKYHRNPTESPGPETEIWYYPNMIFSFSDPFLNGEYTFSSEYNSQVPIDTYESITKLRKDEPIIYNPEFKGPLINIPYTSYQFASDNSKKTDIYIAYQLNRKDTTALYVNNTSSYTCGLFLLDSNFVKIYSHRAYIDGIDTIGTMMMEKSPMKTNIALEIIRNRDNAIASYHGDYTIRNYNTDTLSMSDIVLSSNIVVDRQLRGSIKRNEHSIIPKPDSSYSSNDHIYIYYEIYNLMIGADKLTNYDQLLSLRKINDESLFEKVMDVIGISKTGDKITMKSNYQSLETTSRIYFEIDMSLYEDGEYELAITIKDKNANVSAMRKALLFWRK